MLSRSGNSFLYVLVSLILFSMLTTEGYGQEFSIKGNVTNTKNESLGYVNVLVLQKKDSLVVAGNSTDASGAFKIQNVPTGKYVLKFSYIGYKKRFKEIDLTSDIDLETIVLKPIPEQLDDVTITARRKSPKLKRMADRLVFNVAKTSLTETNIWELLNRTPGVILVNNEITVKGSSDIQVLINDRKVSLPKEDILNLLKGTDAGSVESVELITNPSARYDAEGGALINIKMNKNIAKGYNANVFTNYEIGQFAKYTLGTGHFFKSEKTQLGINYTLSDRKILFLQNEMVDFIQNGDITSIWNNNIEQIRDIKRHTANIFFDYIPNDKNNYSFSVLGSMQPGYKSRFYTTTGINDPDNNPQSSFVTFNNLDGDELSMVLNFDYVRKLNEKGAKLTINAGYTYFEKERFQDIDTDFFLPDGTKTGDNDFTTDVNQRIHIYNAQADFSFPLNHNDEIETGVKFATINSLNTVDQPGFDPSQPGEDPTENDRFDYDESIAAAYFSYSRSWSKWNVKAGLRAEYTETDGISEIQGAVNKNDYLELFPTFYLQYIPDSKHNLSINYGRRISRPKYAAINPFRYFTGNNSFIEGDPALLPSFSDQVTLSYTLNDTYTFEAFYYFEDNALKFLTFQNNESNIIRYLNTNIDRELTYGFDFLTYRPLTKFWDVNLLSSYFYSSERFRNVENQNKLIDIGLWTLFASIDNYFTISAKGGFTAHLGAEFCTEIIQGNARQEDYSAINVSVSKRLFNNKGFLTLGVRDVFNNMNTRVNRIFDNQSSTIFSREENRMFTFAFRYNFGNTRLEGNTKTKTVEERERLN